MVIAFYPKLGNTHGELDFQQYFKESLKIASIFSSNSEYKNTILINYLSNFSKLLYSTVFGWNSFQNFKFLSQIFWSCQILCARPQNYQVLLHLTVTVFYFLQSVNKKSPFQTVYPNIFWNFWHTRLKICCLVQDEISQWL